jgi:hypothetical protein
MIDSGNNHQYCQEYYCDLERMECAPEKSADLAALAIRCEVLKMKKCLKNDKVNTVCKVRSAKKKEEKKEYPIGILSSSLLPPLSMAREPPTPEQLVAGTY